MQFSWFTIQIAAALKQRLFFLSAMCRRSILRINECTNNVLKLIQPEGKRQLRNYHSVFAQADSNCVYFSRRIETLKEKFS